MQPNELIEASAGTGKTQALAERLIELMRLGVRPEEMVALTFSRAAAGEIFERFVSLLAKRGEAELLRRVIATQHLSQIGTLDAFLMRMVRVFPLELGLRGKTELLDEYAAKVEQDSISFSILRRTDSRQVKEFSKSFALVMGHENVRSFVEAYRKFIHNWHENVVGFANPAAWGDVKTIFGTDLASVHTTERELTIAADGLEGVVDSPAWSEFVEWVRNFRGKIKNAKGIAKKLLEIGDLFEHSAVEFKYKNKPYKLNGENAARLQLALKCVLGYVLRQHLEFARGIYSLISVYEREYNARVRQQGKLVFADVPRLIASLNDDSRMALEFRLDSRIKAWALDEFQDTSREQWKVFSPLVEEAKQSAGEQSVFIVGDRKQAIYGWRDGDVGIFEREVKCGAYECRELVESWRFGLAVTEAVNRVFTGGMIKSEFPAWKSPEHKSARPELTGFVQVIEAGGDKKQDFAQPIYNALKAVDPVGRHLSAAILVRSNTFGEMLTRELKHLGLSDVVWEGESDVLNSPALAGFIDLVQLADHPGDALTYRHFCLTAIAAAKYPSGVPSASKISQEFSEAFTIRGLVRTFRELRALFPEDSDVTWNRATEAQFTSLVRAAAEFDFVKRPDTRLSDFPRYLASQRQRTLAEPGRIKVMTIHRSKGLGFDYVLLPLYEHETLNADSKKPLVGENWVLPPIDEEVAVAFPGLRQAYLDRKNRIEQEALCLYYVAMTRARRAITMVLHPSPKNPTGIRFSDLVRNSITEPIGKPDWYLDEDPVKQVVSADEMVESSIAVPARKPRVCLRRRLPSKKYVSGQSAALFFVPRSRKQAAMERGTRIHAEYERVDFNDWIPRPQNLAGLWRERAFETVVNGVWTSGRFDRVVFTTEGAVIQDFKTGRDVQPENYRSQMVSYRQALHALTGIPEANIRLELLLVDSQKVVAL